MADDRKKTGWILAAASFLMFSPLTMILLGYNMPVFQNLGFARDSIASLTTWMLAIIVAIGYVVYTFRVIPFVASMQREISLFKLLGIVSAVVGGIVEEAIFRRWLMDSLMYGGVGPAVQVVSSGVVFGLAHAVWLLAKREFKFALPAMFSTAVLGTLLAAIYLLGRRNLGPCIFAHVLINIVIEPWLLLSSVSGKWKALQ
jgi:membrane protease YdiL (CAAX protease family)